MSMSTLHQLKEHKRTQMLRHSDSPGTS